MRLINPEIKHWMSKCWHDEWLWLDDRSKSADQIPSWLKLWFGPERFVFRVLSALQRWLLTLSNTGPRQASKHFVYFGPDSLDSTFTAPSLRADVKLTYPTDELAQRLLYGRIIKLLSLQHFSGAACILLDSPCFMRVLKKLPDVRCANFLSRGPDSSVADSRFTEPLIKVVRLVSM